MKRFTVFFAVFFLFVISSNLCAQVISAKIVIDKKQIGTDSDKVFENALLPANGGIEGSHNGQKVKLLFSDLLKISYDLLKHVHTVVDKSGKTYELKWGRIFSDNTLPTVRFNVTGQENEEGFSSGEIKLIEFTESPKENPAK